MTVAGIQGDRKFRLQGPGLAVALLFLVTAGGAIGFHLIEGWSLWYSTFVTVQAITTVDLPDLTPTGQAFSVVVLFAGISVALYTFTLVATLVVEGGLPKRMQRRRYARMLESIKDHFIVCGYGRIGRIVSLELKRQKVPHLIIERDPALVQQAVEENELAIAADASREDVLKRAGIEKARGLIAVVGTDAENVYTVLSARVLRPDLFIIARAESEDATLKMKRAGADRVVSPYQIGATQIAQTALRPAVVDFVALATGTDNLDLAMEQVTVAPRSRLANQSILEANLRQRFGVIVVGIQRRDKKMEFNPEPETSILPEDKLVVLGQGDSLKRLVAEARG